MISMGNDRFCTSLSAIAAAVIKILPLQNPSLL